MGGRSSTPGPPAEPGCIRKDRNGKWRSRAKPGLRPGAAGLKGSDAHPPDRTPPGQRRCATRGDCRTARSAGPTRYGSSPGRDETRKARLGGAKRNRAGSRQRRGTHGFDEVVLALREANHTPAEVTRSEP